MEFLNIYDSLEEVWKELESLKTIQYEMADIPLDRRDVLSEKLHEIQKLVLKVKDEVEINIKNEWL